MEKRLPKAGIIIAILVALVVLSAATWWKNRTANRPLPPFNGTPLQSTSADPLPPPAQNQEELFRSYQQALERARIEVQSGELDIMKKRENIEAIFVSVRVPGELRDAHLKAFFEIQKVSTREEMEKILDELIVRHKNITA